MEGLLVVYGLTCLCLVVNGANPEPKDSTQQIQSSKLGAAAQKSTYSGMSHVLYSSADRHDVGSKESFFVMNAFEKGVAVWPSHNVNPSAKF